MANSKYEYVRHFEQSDRLPLGNWIVIRLDGRGFHRFSAKHDFAKPNDVRALKLMNKAAEGVLRDLPDVLMGFGFSDEYSFLLHHSSALYSRRASKLISAITSTFTAHYLLQWPGYFPNSPLTTPSDSLTENCTNESPQETKGNGELEAELLPTGPIPTFDGRAVCYPRVEQVRDYLSWRQVDCHINNLYNTAFWALVLKGGMGNAEAEKALSGTYSADKHELLFSRFSINYNNEPEIYKKGSIIFREPATVTSTLRDPGGDTPGFTWGNPDAGKSNGALSKTQQAKQAKQRQKTTIVCVHEDLITNAFWERRAWLLYE